MTKTQQILEHVIVTFVEAAGAYLIVIPTVNWTKTAVAGAVGAGLSAVYNLLRQSSPTITSQTPAASQAQYTLPVLPPVPDLTVAPTDDEKQNDILNNLANEPESAPKI